jgi:hypothetical protein
MSTRRRYSFWIDDTQARGLKVIKERDGVLESEQIRRALDQWLRRRGVGRPEARRAFPRPRSS